MFARVIYITLFVIAALILGYTSYMWHYHDEEFEYAALALVPLIPAVSVYVLSPQINWWWYTKQRTPKVDEKLRVLLEARLPFYQRLSAEDKEKFTVRVTLFIMAKNFVGKVHKEVPEDMKAVIAASAVQLTFGYEEDWLFDEYEQYIIYPHPFPTPQYEAWHITEHFAEDGVILFSAEHLLHGFFEPHRYYQIALHEFANVYLEKHGHSGLPNYGETAWTDFAKISTFTERKLKAYIGLDNVRPEAVGLTLFFTHRQRFAQVLPQAFEKLQRKFG